jgi:hypothetical protein
MCLLGAWARAGDAPAPEPAPCSGPAYRAFDFWAGTWRVYNAAGAHAGDSRVAIAEEGCVLVERWRSTRGVTGLSLNFYDPEKSAWRQIWIGPASQIELEGNLLGAYMVLEGRIRYLRDGKIRPFRGTWAPLPDGGVRQTLEEGNEAGEWTPWFEGFYRRAPVESPNLDKRG